MFVTPTTRKCTNQQTTAAAAAAATTPGPSGGNNFVSQLSCRLKIKHWEEWYNVSKDELLDATQYIKNHDDHHSLLKEANSLSTTTHHVVVADLPNILRSFYPQNDWKIWKF